MHPREENRRIRRSSRSKKESRLRASGKPWYTRVLDNLRRRLQTQLSSIRIHGFLFLAVSALLIGLNVMSTPFPWAYFPIAAWGIGIAGHLQALLNRRREVGQLTQVPDIQEETGRVLRQYQKSVGAWNQHRTAFLMVNGYLWGINLITSTAFLWAAIVTGAWGIGFGCHWMANSARRKFLREKLKGMNLDWRTMKTAGRRLPGRPDADENSLAGRARTISENLLRQYRENDRLRDHWAGIEPLLKTTVEQIAELEKKRDDFDRLTHSFSVDDLEEELAKARVKRERTMDDLLRQEYDRSIAQYQQHLKAAAGLTHHRELLELRLNGAFQLVKQLEIDTIRLLNVESFTEPSSLSALRAKTDENQLFLDDFKQSLIELERDL
jgi:hypothetical protein